MTEDEAKLALEQVENQIDLNDSEGHKDDGEAREEGAPIPRHLVTAIVKKERLKAIQKAKREFMQEMEAQQAAQVSPVSPVAVQPQSAPQVGMGGMSNISPEQIHQMIASEAQKLDEKRRQEDTHAQQQQAAYNIAQQFNSQMANGKAKRPDFDDKVKDLEFNSMSEIVHLAAETGIADEIMYDLAENPQKITHLMILAHTQPKLARAEMQKLAGSIKANQAAVQQASPREPVSQITPSVVGTDSGNMSVADFRKMFQ